MLRNLKQFLVVLCCVGATQAWAQERSDPLTSLFRTPFAPTLLQTPCQLGLQLMVANNLTGSQGPWGRVDINLEEWRVNFLYRQRWETANGPLEFGLDVPLRLFWAGLLDAPLDAYHALLGVPGNPPGTAYQSELGVLLQNKDGGLDSFVLRGVSFGFGDAVAWLTVPLETEVGPFGVSLVLRLPVGDARRLLGSGVVVLGGTLTYASENWGAQLTGSVPLQSGTVLPQVLARPSWGARLWWDVGFLPGWWPATRLELTLYQSALVMPGAWGGLQLGFMVQVANVGFSEDITRGLPDVVFDYPLVFACP